MAGCTDSFITRKPQSLLPSCCAVSPVSVLIGTWTCSGQVRQDGRVNLFKGMRVNTAGKTKGSGL